MTRRPVVILSTTAGYDPALATSILSANIINALSQNGATNSLYGFLRVSLKLGISDRDHLAVVEIALEI
jgi:hypothetical protein